MVGWVATTILLDLFVVWLFQAVLQQRIVLRDRLVFAIATSVIVGQRQAKVLDTVLHTAIRWLRRYTTKTGSLTCDPIKAKRGRRLFLTVLFTIWAHEQNDRTTIKILSWWIHIQVHNYELTWQLATVGVLRTLSNGDVSLVYDNKTPAERRRLNN